jgi:hypothetical protein
MAHLKRNHVELAIADYSSAIQLHPGNAILYVYRGLAKLRAGRDTEAGKDFDRCLALEPGLKRFIRVRSFGPRICCDNTRLSSNPELGPSDKSGWQQDSTTSFNQSP